MKKAYAVYLGIVLLVAALVVPWALKTIAKSKAILQQQEESLRQQAAPQPPAEAPAVSTETTEPEVPAKPPAEAAKKPIAEKPTPEPLPGAGASIDAGGASDCVQAKGLKQAVNPNPRASQYQGQLLIAAGEGKPLEPCISSGTYEHPTLGKFSVRPKSKPRRLSPGTHPAPGGTVTIERR